MQWICELCGDKPFKTSRALSTHITKKHKADLERISGEGDWTPQTARRMFVDRHTRKEDMPKPTPPPIEDFDLPNLAAKPADAERTLPLAGGTKLGPGPKPPEPTPGPGPDELDLRETQTCQCGYIGKVAGQLKGKGRVYRIECEACSREWKATHEALDKELEDKGELADLPFDHALNGKTVDQKLDEAGVPPAPEAPTETAKKPEPKDEPIPVASVYPVPEDFAEKVMAWQEGDDLDAHIHDMVGLLVGLGGTVERKIDGIASLWSVAKAQEKIATNEIDRLKRRKRRAASLQTRMKRVLKEFMVSTGLTKIETGKFRATRTLNPPKVKSIDRNDAPGWCFRHEINVVPQKALILEHMKRTGEVPPGVEIEREESVRIY